MLIVVALSARLVLRRGGVPRIPEARAQRHAKKESRDHVPDCQQKERVREPKGPESMLQGPAVFIGREREISVRVQKSDPFVPRDSGRRDALERNLRLFGWHRR